MPKKNNAGVISKAVARVVKSIAKTKTKPKNKPRKSRSMVLAQTNDGMSRRTAYVSIGTAAPQCGYATRRTASHGGEIVANCELIDTAVVTTNNTGFYGNAFFDIQPGDQSVFTWLGPIAASHQNYIIRKLHIYYIPVAGSTYEGQVLIFPSYSMNIAVPTTELTFMNNRDAHAHVLWDGFRVECDVESMNQNGTHRVRAGIAAGDANLYECLRVFVATTNAGAVSQSKTVGKIYIDYEFEFYNPINSSLTISQPAASSHYIINASQVTSTGFAGLPQWFTFYDGLGIGDQGTFNSRVGVFNAVPGFYAIRCNLTVRDSVNEQLTLLLQVRHGPNFYAGGQTTVTSVTGVANGILQVSVYSIINFAVNDDIAIVLTATGAAGVLTILTGQLEFFLA